MQIDYLDIGNRIRAERLKQNFSQEKLAEMAGVGTTHISHIETGNTVPSIKTFIAIINALNLSSDELLRNHIDKAKHVLVGELADTLSDCTDSTPWNGERFRMWAAPISPNAVCVVESILARFKVEQQGYRACIVLLKLGAQYSSGWLESTCAMALDYTPQPSYKSIQTILKSGRDRIAAETPAPAEPSAFGFTRGAANQKDYRVNQ